MRTWAVLTLGQPRYLEPTLCARTGYELSQIESSYEALKDDGFTLDGWETSPFLIFVRTIPGRFYPIAMLCLQLLLILTKRDFGAMLKAEQRALNEKKLFSDSADNEQARRLLLPLAAPTCSAHLGESGSVQSQ